MESQTGVPGVPKVGVKVTPMAAEERLPHLTADGTLSIPFDSPERYHWWRGGQSVAATINELLARMGSASQSVESPKAERGQAGMVLGSESGCGPREIFARGKIGVA